MSPNQKAKNIVGADCFLQTSEELEHHMQAQLALCDELEGIADSLPNEISTYHCLLAAQRIYPIIKSAHIFEETKLFPVIEDSDMLNVSATMDRLHGEHWADEEYSHELSESLKDFVAGRDNNSEKLGYMLRGFFEGLRRHIAFEREFVAPILNSSSSGDKR